MSHGSASQTENTSYTEIMKRIDNCEDNMNAGSTDQSRV